MDDRTWLGFWGKARPHEAGSGPMHPLAAHALDVAAVAMLMPRPTAAVLPRRTLGFLVALHDIGKFSRTFQSLVPEYWPAGVLGPLPDGPLQGPRHDALGYHLIRSLADDLNSVLPPRQSVPGGWNDGDLTYLFQALAGHHGRPVDPDGHVPPAALCAACREAARDFVAAMLDAFRPPPLMPPTGRSAAQRLGWDLAGAVTLADWVGSREAWFPYVTEAAVADPTAYLWDHALPRAAAALAQAGLAAAPASRFGGIRGLFPRIEVPSPIQDWAATVQLRVPRGRGDEPRHAGRCHAHAPCSPRARG